MTPPHSSSFFVAAAQREPLPLGTPLSEFEDDVQSIVTEHPEVKLVVYPELHLNGVLHLPESERNGALVQSAVSLNDPRVHDIGDVAQRADVWLIPGSICEAPENTDRRREELFNTELLFAPDGTLVSSYRKVFPWRPFEPYTPGDRFTVAQTTLADIGLSICYDAWFPETTRHLAWLGAQVVANVVQTTTPDREQETVLARANSIVNQNFTVSVNCAAPSGAGRSLIVDPEGRILAEAGAEPTTLIERIDLSLLSKVQRDGTAGTNRVWAQLREDDPPIQLPLYDGDMTPNRWGFARAPRH